MKRGIEMGERHDSQSLIVGVWASSWGRAIQTVPNSV